MAKKANAKGKGATARSFGVFTTNAKTAPGRAINARRARGGKGYVKGRVG